MMGLNPRKLAIGLIALSVLAGVFALYMRFDRTPPIIVDVAASKPSSTIDVNFADPNEDVGTVSGIGLGPVQHTEFVHRTQSSRIDRKFGFEALLHRQGSQWEITKPYMWMYLERFSCRVTADRGRVELVEAFGRAMPSDAVFTGNVVIHIVPTDPNDPWECFIHLDDVGFLAEKSMFSSQGAVRFLSRAMRLTGTGMELLYDAPRSRLELFRVFDLDSLRLRSSEIKAAAQKDGDSSQHDATGPATAQDSGEAASTAAVDSNAPPADVYQCVFRSNVRLNSPEMVAVARDVLSINHIQGARPNGRDAKGGQAVDPNGTRTVPSSDGNALNTATSSYPAMNAMPDDLYDIVVTCDGGADITLLGAPGLANASPVRPPVNPPAAGTPASQEFAAPDRQQVVAQRVDFDFVTNDATMLGPVAMRLLVDPNNAGGTAAGKPMPLDVSAQGAVRYLAMLKQIVLEGGSTATLQRVEPNSVDKYRIAAPRLTLDLTVDSNATDNVKVDLRRFVADSGPETAAGADLAGVPPVTVRMWHWAADKLVGWGALDAYELQYDAEQVQLAAAGPGVIWLHNAATIQSKSDPNAALKPCYARLSNFDSLKYWGQSKRIVAEDDSQQLELHYFPLIDDKWGPQTQVVAGHVEATLQEIAPNRMDLLSLVASQGIEYDSEIDQLNFIGSEMVYDRAKSLITIQGDDLRPCYLNGALVDRIMVDPKTRKVEAEVGTTSIFQVRR